MSASGWKPRPLCFYPLLIVDTGHYQQAGGAALSRCPIGYSARPAGGRRERDRGPLARAIAVVLYANTAADSAGNRPSRGFSESARSIPQALAENVSGRRFRANAAACLRIGHRKRIGTWPDDPAADPCLNFARSGRNSPGARIARARRRRDRQVKRVKLSISIVRERDRISPHARNTGRRAARRFRPPARRWRPRGGRPARAEHRSIERPTGAHDRARGRRSGRHAWALRLGSRSSQSIRHAGAGRPNRREKQPGNRARSQSPGSAYRRYILDR